ncbi:MAG: hypothetical protein WBP53_16920 [Dokdonella sp.]
MLERRSLLCAHMAALALMSTAHADTGGADGSADPDASQHAATLAVAPDQDSPIAGREGQEDASPYAVSQSDSDGWKYAATLYGYLPSIDGETTFPSGAAGPSFTIDQHRIVSGLKFAFMGSVRAHKGNWGFLADLFYAKLGDSANLSGGFAINGIPVQDASANLKLDSKTTILSLAGTYALADKPRHVTRLVFGTRMLDTQQKLDWQLTGTVPGVGTAGLSGMSNIDRTKWDGIVGLTGHVRFGEGLRWSVPYYVDAGAGDSNFTSQALVGIGYSYDWGDVVAAWRYIDYDFKSGELISRLSFSGPALGAVFRF